jgi:hypothetical protein
LPKGDESETEELVLPLNDLGKKATYKYGYKPKYGTAEFKEWKRQYDILYREKNHIKRLRLNWESQGINPDKAEQMYLTFNNCFICDIEVQGRNKHVDHNHKTGKVRGILCNYHNLFLGFIENETEYKLVRQYLKEYNK